MKGLVAGIALMMMAGAASAATVEERYNSSCTFCHTSGAAGAPKAHDEAAWKPLLAKGMDTLVKHVKEGYNAMPPKGGNMSLSDEEVQAAVDFMVKAAE